MSSILYVDPGVDSDLKFSISGVDWVAGNVAVTRRPSVVSMSLQGGAFDPLDNAVTNVIFFLLVTKPSTNFWNSWSVEVFPLWSQVSYSSGKPVQLNSDNHSSWKLC